ncbi:MAG: GSU2403 family nucleotidyltransferase fold protein [Elusimicrobiota bacterium]|nr:GSU2403 family nucleotidyltransferase fold protein [Elusimicrobiota bacterium]
MRRLSPETHTLYAELLDQLTAVEARRSIGALKGCFTTKNIKGETYYYFQHFGLNGAAVQLYLGRKAPALDALAAKFKEEKAFLKPDLDRIKMLCAQIKAGGGLHTGAAHASVLSALAATGVFRLGGVLVGTHAFAAIGNMLGVNWEAAVKTQDIDIAASKTINIAFPAGKADVPAALENLKLGFLPVPQLDPKKPSTSFKVRGSTLTVDILTPGVKEALKPVFIAALNTAAQPLPFLGYLIEAAERAAVVNGEGILVNLPTPARFAFHKLIVSRERAAAMQAKVQKDLAQAAAMFSVISEDRPGDILLAYAAIVARGPSWTGKLKKALPVFAAKYPGECEKLFSTVPELKA